MYCLFSNFRKDVLQTHFFYLLADLSFQFFAQIRIVVEHLFDLIASLTKFGVSVREERTAFLDDLGSNCEIQDLTDARDTFVEHEVELGFLERRSHFVFHHFDAHLVTLDLLAVFDLTRLADVETDRGV